MEDRLPRKAPNRIKVKSPSEKGLRRRCVRQALCLTNASAPTRLAPPESPSATSRNSVAWIRSLKLSTFDVVNFLHSLQDLERITYARRSHAASIPTIHVKAAAVESSRTIKKRWRKKHSRVMNPIISAIIFHGELIAPISDATARRRLLHTTQISATAIAPIRFRPPARVVGRFFRTPSVAPSPSAGKPQLDK